MIGNGAEKKFFNIQNGYTFATEEQLKKLRVAINQNAPTMEAYQGALRIGIHHDVQVTSKGWGSQMLNDPDQIITQVFGSACAVGYNEGTDSSAWKEFASLILEASYEATLLVGLLTAHQHKGKCGSHRIFLTCLGGGVFGNEMEWIAQAIYRACYKFKAYDLDIRINSYAPPIDPLLENIAKAFTESSVASREVKERPQTEATGSSSSEGGMPIACVNHHANSHRSVPPGTEAPALSVAEQVSPDDAQEIMQNDFHAQQSLAGTMETFPESSQSSSSAPPSTPGSSC